MADFVACLWRPGRLRAAGEQSLAVLRAGLEDADRWRLVHDSPGLWIFGLSARPIRVRPLVDRPGAVVGDLFSSDNDRPLGDTAPSLGHSGDLAEACTRLTRQVWGRYVAIFSSVERYESGVYRGPVGGLECVTARCGSIVIAATRLPNEALKLLAPKLSIDWPRLAGLISDPGGIGGAVTLRGAASLAPGSLWRWNSNGEREDLIWRPADFARVGWRGGDPAPSLEHRIDSCVRAWSDLYSPIVAELSGGLDSAIVGAALTRAGADVRKWINFHTAARTGDERPYARAVADQLGVALTEEAKPVAAFEPSRLAEACEGPRPSLNRLDAPYDDRMAQLAGDAGARAIFTGQGGDVLFYGMSTPLLAVDHLRRRGFGGLGSPFLANLARRRRQSFWSLARTGLAGWVSAGSRGATPRSHPWLDGDQSDLGPAKRHQLEQLVYCLRFFGPSRRTRVTELIHPLLSQPVVELCLSIPADLLVEEGRERGLVRRAFAERLPSKVIDRRSKGDLTLFYGRSVALALPQLRETLLGGALVAHGALEAQALNDRLDLDRLAVEGRHTEIMTLAALDAWASCWQARLDRARTGRQR